MMLKPSRLVLLIALAFSSFYNQAAIGDKRYDQVTFACTHNAQSYKPRKKGGKITISIQNQDKTIGEQLNAGIRGMKLPIHKHNNNIYACHGIDDGLIKQVKEMVDNNKTVKAIRKKPKKKALGRFKKATEKIINKTIKTIFSDTLTDVYFKPDKVKNNPCSIDPAQTKITSVLKTVKKFLDTHPNEIVTLFLEVFSGKSDSIVQACDQTGISTYLYVQPTDADWPTINELIKKNKRLIIFTSKPINAKYFNQKKHFCWSTPYNYENVEKLKKELKEPGKGPPGAWKTKKNKLWIMQNFVTKQTHGSKEAAQQVNNKSVILSRANAYKKKYDLDNPNFIWVDFFEVPKNNNIFDAVKELNK